MTTFVREICKAIGVLGHDVVLMVPMSNEVATIEYSMERHFEVVKFGLGIDLTGRIGARERILFINAAKSFFIKSHDQNPFDVFHILFGLYSMKYFNFENLGKCITKGVTIHNIPPMECARSWPGDIWYKRLWDEIRLVGVGWVNRFRITYQKWDAYVVPSNFVNNQLSALVDPDKVYTVAHGMSFDNLIRAESEVDGVVTILTVSGFTPHKAQHLIPDIADKLNNYNIDFLWHVVGPPKNKEYTLSIKDKLEKYGLMDRVKLHFSISDDSLAKLYSVSQLYVHPSLEEGFCLTALEAASFGLNIIGRNTGAIPEIVSKSKGLVVSGSISSFVEAIYQFCSNINAPKEQSPCQVSQHFNWETAAEGYIDIFEEKRC